MRVFHAHLYRSAYYYGKPPTMQEKYKAVELSCISGRSKSGRSKLGRNGDGKGGHCALRQTQTNWNLNKGQERNRNCLWEQLRSFFLKIERRTRMNVREQADRAGLL